ncbi:carbohydrate porin [Paraburkholderia caledonica]|uniref:carbohydrate porin n=1 Tax=Paraburkholderia caledonica TaxID=134536 RepID=UPI000DEFADB0
MRWDLIATRLRSPLPGYPARSSEIITDATYLYQVTPWWQLQADFQYVFRHAGGIPNPENRRSGWAMKRW